MTIRLTGRAAIDFAEHHPDVALRKHADPTEGARDELTLTEGRAIADVDDGLVYVELRHALCYVLRWGVDCWGTEVTDDEHAEACARAEEWLTENEGAALSISVRPARGCAVAGDYSIDAYGRERDLGGSVPEDVVALSNAAWEHACESWPEADAPEGDPADAEETTDEHLVVVETMPRYLRASHVAANNRGIYPHNGAMRAVTTRMAAEAFVRGDDWSRVVRDATENDIATLQRVVDPASLT